MARLAMKIPFLFGALAIMAVQAHAQDAWNPFKDWNGGRNTPRYPRADASAERPQSPLPDAGSVAVERGELAPIIAQDGSGLPLELWQGLDVQAIEEHVARLEGPARSPTLHGLWKRLWTSTANPPGGPQGAPHFAAVRIEAMYRAGMLDDLAQVLDRQESGSNNPLLGALEARARIALGDRDRGCAAIRAVVAKVSELPKPIAAEALLISGYCAAAQGNAPAAGLAADLVREQHSGSSLGLTTLDALAAGTKPKFDVPKRVTALDYRFLQLAGAGGGDLRGLLDKAEPALLVAIARDESAELATRVLAAEAASRINAIADDVLAEVYRSTADQIRTGGPQAGRGAELQRALLFSEAIHARAPAEKARLLRRLIDEARQANLSGPVTQLVGRNLDGIFPAPELGWFAETAIEASLAAGRGELARQWAAFSGLQHWLPLADIADPGPRGLHGGSFEVIGELVRRGQVAGEFLPRLATVLDALDVQVPLDLWDAANRMPQPTNGHLPETGVLSQLQDASRKKEFARTLLLTMRTLGPDGAAGAHMIALGDAIRALKRIGLEPDARRLGFEALFASWPRVASR